MADANATERPLAGSLTRLEPVMNDLKHAVYAATYLAAGLADPVDNKLSLELKFYRYRNVGNTNVGSEYLRAGVERRLRECLPQWLEELAQEAAADQLRLKREALALAMDFAAPAVPQ